ncbi:MAG: acyl-CoA/acyl-ACP dehydrogenase [Demequinaceae bacterium]|nr:acyl-CoA/acyl-ACP dehydrogenase [Demequinaceae bacterium]
MSATTDRQEPDTLRTLPGDDVRQIMWRFADRFDLQMVVQSVRAVARGPVARLVAGGGRNSHDWTDEKNALLAAFDESGITALGAEPEHGGYLEGPQNLAMALAAFELSWVDAGAATSSLASHLGLSPIHEHGTPEQKQTYLSRAVPTNDGDICRGAFALTEPLPYVGVDTGVLSGKAKIAEWNDGEEPILQIDKRGRFITGMDFANMVTAAVDSADERINGSFFVILEEGDEGMFDRGAPTLKLVHQLSSTRDPIFNLKVPASRIVGGYTIKDGVLTPNVSHSEVLNDVFRHTRVPVGLMTSAKLLSAVEPIIRYQRGRFRGGEGKPGTPRHDLGLQQKEDALHRLIDVWATGEAMTSLGLATARLFDEYDPLKREKDRIFAERGVTGIRAMMGELKTIEKAALEFLDGRASGETSSGAVPGEDPLIRFVIDDSLTSVLCPATKLWNTGYGATVMREAVSLVGGYGITEDCPGFLGQKWMDAQLEATYEGPEAVQRRQLSITMANPVFLRQFDDWIVELGQIAGNKAGLGASTLASAMKLWRWTLDHLRETKDADGKPLFRDNRQGVTFPMGDALSWLVASRYQMLDVLELESKGKERPELAESLPGTVQFFTDLCRVQAARAAGEVGRMCAELVYGYQRQPSGEALATFQALRSELDESIAEARLAKDRAARSLTGVMIPEALDYPA